jgi:hypothetical protein
MTLYDEKQRRIRVALKSGEDKWAKIFRRKIRRVITKKLQMKVRG